MFRGYDSYKSHAQFFSFNYSCRFDDSGWNLSNTGQENLKRIWLHCPCHVSPWYTLWHFGRCANLPFCSELADKITLMSVCLIWSHCQQGLAQFSIKTRGSGKTLGLSLTTVKKRPTKTYSLLISMLYLIGTKPNNENKKRTACWLYINVCTNITVVFIFSSISLQERKWATFQKCPTVSSGHDFLCGKTFQTFIIHSCATLNIYMASGTL